MTHQCGVGAEWRAASVEVSRRRHGPPGLAAKMGGHSQHAGRHQDCWILDRRDVTPAVTMSANQRNRDALWWFSLHGQCLLMVTAGTIFARTRTPLRTWFAAARFVTSQKNGVSALGLQRFWGYDHPHRWAWQLRRFADLGYQHEFFTQLGPDIPGM